MEVLITGCAGFVGSHLTEKMLEMGHSVIGIDCFKDYYPKRYKEKNIENSLNDNNFELIEANILDIDVFPEVDYIFHQAAQAGVRKSWGKSFKEYTDDNILGTQKLLEWYKNKKIEKLIYASSSSVYGDAILPMSEESMLKPMSPYGVTKLAAENLCHLYYKNYGVPIVSLRYFTVYGPRQRPDMAIHLFVKAILENELIKIYGDGNQTRDFTYISDVVDANLRAAFSNAKGEIFNVGGGNRITVNDLIRVIENTIGIKANLDYIEKQKGDVKDTLAKSVKIRELGWEPKIGIQEGIKNFVDWYKAVTLYPKV